MEIERKFRITEIPADFDIWPHYEIEQGYLSTAPVLRIRYTGDFIYSGRRVTAVAGQDRDDSPAEQEIPELDTDDMPEGVISEDTVASLHLPEDVRPGKDTYTFTYKSGGLLKHQEISAGLTREAYLHLREKCDGRVILKTRYIIPLEEGYRIGLPDSGEAAQMPKLPERNLRIELDHFRNVQDKGHDLWLAEVEFPTEEAADRFYPPQWFGEDVTMDRRYHNSEMTKE